MCVLGLTEDLEARVLKGKPREKHRERRRVPRKMGDGACRDSGDGTAVVEQAELQEKFPRFNSMYYCCIAVRI